VLGLQGAVLWAYSKVWTSWAPEAAPKGGERWGRACLWRTRGWLPERKDAGLLDVGCVIGNVLRALRMAGYRNVEGGAEHGGARGNGEVLGRCDP
jgi:hypothetical protein